jgi:hypothetical protein
MLITRDSAVGVDKAIEELQTKLHTGLVSLWDLEDTSVYKCYGRCYRNRRESGYVAEVYEGNNEYKECYWDDSLYALSFFGLSDTIEIGVQSSVDAHLIFFVDLSRVLSGADRNDEKARVQILNILGAGDMYSPVKSVELTLDNILREYKGSITEQLRNHVEMHPVHCFRVNLELIYETTLSNCTIFKSF